MIKVAEIYDLLNQVTPFELQENWDNSGLNLGSMENEVKEIHLSLDIDEDIVNNATHNTLFICHHPLFFKTIKNFHYDFYPSNLAKILIQKNCSLIALHTNFDKTHLNLYFAENILGLKDGVMDSFALRYEVESIDFLSLCIQIKTKMNLEHLVCVPSSNKTIKKIFVICGSGASYLYQKSISPYSCIITGDIKYHDAMIAKSMNIAMIDATHYNSEINFGQILESILNSKGYQVIIKNSKNPFIYL